VRSGSHLPQLGVDGGRVVDAKEDAICRTPPPVGPLVGRKLDELEGCPSGSLKWTVRMPAVSGFQSAWGDDTGWTQWRRNQRYACSMSLATIATR